MRRIGVGCTHALFTKTSTSRNSCGNPPTNALTSSGTETSSFTGRTLTPGACFPISAATSFNVSMRRAVKISLRSSGCVFANSNAVDFPMPELAPVIRIVLPLRRAAMDDIFAVWRWIAELRNRGVMWGSCVEMEGRRIELANEVLVWRRWVMRWESGCMYT